MYNSHKSTYRLGEFGIPRLTLGFSPRRNWRRRRRTLWSRSRLTAIWSGGLLFDTQKGWICGSYSQSLEAMRAPKGAALTDRSTIWRWGSLCDDLMLHGGKLRQKLVLRAEGDAFLVHRQLKVFR